MNDIRLKAIKFEAEKYGCATNEFVNGFVDGYKQGIADEREKVLEEAMKSVYFWEMWLHDAIREDRGRLGYNIGTAFIEINNALKELKEQKGEQNDTLS